MLEDTQVPIVGAGPAGLTLGLSLAQYQSVIREKEKDITSDPRGVYLTGDAVRVFQNLGLGPHFPNIGHFVEKMDFHQTSFAAKPFLSMDVGSDSLHQMLPNGMLQMQPRLEHYLRAEIAKSGYCTSRSGCEVINRLESNPPIIQYRTEDGSEHRIRAQYLIGADGKCGVVRKYFLEASAGIKQEEGIYRYSETWVAANLKIRLPTQQSHPKFPLWALGYTSEQIYDLFWPKNWHFCSPPGKPTASGRFGPHEERLWRHEFRQEDWNDEMEAVELLWEHLNPLITRDRDEKGVLFRQRVQFPLDCIEIIRCRPFSFVHKVVNKWFAERTILIGDAAHVFPPFAGQGIASGVRDAYQLAWRLDILLKDSRISENASTSFLEAWALERRKSVDDAALLSMMNGKLCNKKPTLWLLVLMRLIGMLSHIPYLRRAFDSQAKMNFDGFTSVEKGFFLKQYNGGIPLAQIIVQSDRQGSILSDQMFRSKVGLLSLLVITRGDHAKAYSEAKEAIEAAVISSAVISTDSIVLFSPSSGTMPLKGSYDTIEDGPELFWPS